MQGRSSRRGTPIRRAGSATLTALLVGALVVPASSLASGAAPTPQPDSITILENAGPTTLDVLANDTDPEGDALTLTALSNANTDKYTVAVTPGQPGVLTITPATNYHGGPTTFSYTVSDGTAARSATVSVTVTHVNQVPVAADLDATIDEDTDYEVTTAELLAGATDGDGDSLSVDGVSNAAHGTVELAAGTATFSPTANYCGAAAGFDFTVIDGLGGSDTGHVALTVTCIEDLPVAADQAVDVAYNTATAFVLDASDGDDDPLEFTIVTQPAHGTLSGTAPNLTYTPSDDPTPYVGSDSFTWHVSDGKATTTDATVTIEVADDVAAPVVTEPSVAFGTGRVNESAPLVISWSADDGDGVGLKSYEVQVKVGAADWAAFSGAMDTSKSAFYGFGQELRWRVRATDNNDNVSDWVLSPVRKLVAYQGGKPVTYKGTWTTVKSNASSGVNYKHTTVAGRNVALTFTGLGVLYVAPKMSTGGYAKVKIAGTTYRVNLRSSTTTYGVIVKSRTWSTSASRSIKVINDQAGRRTTFDAFVVLK